MDRVGAHLGCVLNIHDFNKRRFCKKYRFVEMKPKNKTIKCPNCDGTGKYTWGLNCIMCGGAKVVVREAKKYKRPKKLDCFYCHGKCGCHSKNIDSLLACGCPFNGALKGTLTLKKMNELYKKSIINDGDYPAIVGRIEVMKNYLGTKKDFMKALNFQLKVLKHDMIKLYKKEYEEIN